MPETMIKGAAKKPRGHVEIDTERCKGCGFCAQFCPTGVLAMSNGFNRKGYHPPIIVNAARCSGCDLCGMYCPDFSIHGLRDGNTGKKGTGQ